MYISIIVPVYNVEKYLHRCIDSLLAQTFSDFEILLVNDGSKDNSGMICDEYARKDSRIRVFHKENGGVSSARNMGLDNAKGDWIAFCDSDDWLDKRFLELMYDKAQIEQADIVMCDFNMICRNHIERWESADWTDDKVYSMQSYIKSTWTCLCLMLVRRKLCVDNDLYSPENISYCEDFHLAVRLCYYAHKVVHLNEALYNYNLLNGMSAIHTQNEKTMNDEQWAYCDIIRFFEQKGEYENYRRNLCWRILKSKQEWVLHTYTHDKFMALHPDSHHFILSCPYINVKQKIMMWCLTHRLGIVTRLIIKIRTLLRR